MAQPVKGPQVRCAKTLIRAIAGVKGDTIREVVQQTVIFLALASQARENTCEIA